MQRLMLIAVSAFVLIFFSADRPAPKAEKLKWMTLDEAREAMLKEKRPILIDLYTDWCGWCKVMDKKTYSNSKVIAYLQQHFYPVKVNAETRETLNWNEKAYKYNSANRTNDFALFLTYGKLSYPTTVILLNSNNEPQPVPGYLEPKELELFVRYFGDGKYGKQPFEEYQKSFKSEW
ncbi:MAG: thioredoxin family protein [Bacteroidota bacterium]